MSREDFEEYLEQNGLSSNENARMWLAAIGLQEADGTVQSEFLFGTAKRHIKGDITIDEAKANIDSYHKSEWALSNTGQKRTEEADKVSVRITELLGTKDFSFTTNELIGIHRHLFSDIYRYAGQIREHNIRKAERILGGSTVLHSSVGSIMTTLEFDMNQEGDFSYEGLSQEQSVSHICRFIANLWQIHPFRKGDTRTIAVFLMKYLTNLGYNVNYLAFANNSAYFRNALVLANYMDTKRGIHVTFGPLERFMLSLLSDDTVDLEESTLRLRTDENDEEKVRNKTYDSLKKKTLMLLRTLSSPKNLH